MPPSSDDIIRLDRITKRFGAFTALHETSLAIRRGEFLSLLGPSGCGKTTLLRILAGFHTPSGGTLHIDGRSMGGVPPDRRPVNTVFQNYALFPHMTVADNVAFGPRRAGRGGDEVRRDVAAALEMVGMGGFADRLPRSLSGGQQQRIALARAIINRPKVLLLDEPLGALDLKLRKRMQMELKHLHDRLGISFVYVTHDQEEALAMSDRIAVMDKGRIEQIGTGEDLYRRPTSAYVADFVGEANILDCVTDAGGAVRLGPDGALTGGPGDSGRLVIRPEHIVLDAEGARAGQGMTTLPVQVVERIFLGKYWRIATRTVDGQEIVVSTSTEAPPPEAGQSVTLAWSGDAARVLPR